MGGHDLARTCKYRNSAKGNPRGALVVGDPASTNPWSPRGIRIHGTADIVQRDGNAGPGTYLRLRPSVSWSWNAGRRAVRKADHRGQAGGGG